ncbi:Transcription antitermination protein UpdY [Mucinivorans hirudinis]|uniref:Transcription antitermination protein UpdY n=1 Tax=Mucinivorans hirudinis TaxID=1433126 RepID=A0A060RAU0_9BACT|nr:Transcription antitermination protein UpdY [Mucinivorans hirudinis]
MEESVEWYAVRVTYCREFKLKEILDSLKIDNYIPVQYREVTRNGKKKKILQPVIRNLVFIRTSRETLDAIKKDVEGVLPIRYMYNNAAKAPVTINDSEMRQFIAVSGMLNEQLIYVTLDGCKLKRGDRVRVTGGIFEGVEGDVVRIKNDRRVLVTINGVMAVATSFIHPSLLQKIN